MKYFKGHQFLKYIFSRTSIFEIYLFKDIGFRKNISSSTWIFEKMCLQGHRFLKDISLKTWCCREYFLQRHEYFFKGMDLSKDISSKKIELLRKFFSKIWIFKGYFFKDEDL